MRACWHTRVAGKDPWNLWAVLVLTQVDWVSVPSPARCPTCAVSQVPDLHPAAPVGLLSHSEGSTGTAELLLGPEPVQAQKCHQLNMPG